MLFTLVRLLHVSAVRASVVELPALRRATATDDQPYAVASLLSGDGRLLNTFFGTSFGVAKASAEPPVYADLCCPFGGAPAPTLLLFVPGAVAPRDAGGVANGEATTRRVPPGAASMSDVWLAMLPIDADGECACAGAVCASVTDALAGLGGAGGSQPARQLVLLAYESGPAASDQAAAA